jgi:hypothetical protein
MIDPELRATHPPPTATMLRQFAGLWLALFGSLAFAEFALRHRNGYGALYALVGAAVGLVGLWRPLLIKGVFTVAMAVATPIGLIVSRVLLVVLFCVVFVPVAIVFRMMGRDALSRHPRRGLTTYWTPKAQPKDLKSYLRQS